MLSHTSAAIWKNCEQLWKNLGGLQPQAGWWIRCHDAGLICLAYPSTLQHQACFDRLPVSFHEERWRYNLGSTAAQSLFQRVLTYQFGSKTLHYQICRRTSPSSSVVCVQFMSCWFIISYYYRMPPWTFSVFECRVVSFSCSAPQILKSTKRLSPVTKAKQKRLLIWNGLPNLAVSFRHLSEQRQRDIQALISWSVFRSATPTHNGSFSDQE